MDLLTWPTDFQIFISEHIFAQAMTRYLSLRMLVFNTIRIPIETAV